MIRKKCWYIVRDSKVLAVSTAEPNREDSATRGEEVIESPFYEENIMLIKFVDPQGNIEIKPTVEVVLSKVAENLLMASISGENYQGVISLNIHGTIIEAETGTCLEINTLPDYSLSLFVMPSNEYIGIVKEQ